MCPRVVHALAAVAQTRRAAIANAPVRDCEIVALWFVVCCAVGDSYKQVRSLGSAVADALQNTTFDVFALDFGSTSAAVFGSALLAEAEYFNDCLHRIRAMYADRPANCTGVCDWDAARPPFADMPSPLVARCRLQQSTVPRVLFQL